jgi:hypothetical protein
MRGVPSRLGVGPPCQVVHRLVRVCKGERQYAVSNHPVRWAANLPGNITGMLENT